LTQSTQGGGGWVETRIAVVPVCWEYAEATALKKYQETNFKVKK